jgi:hypothetical protein
MGFMFYGLRVKYHKNVLTLIVYTTIGIIFFIPVIGRVRYLRLQPLISLYF